ncbi:hypothetical protein [Pseudoalteromonas luteoviolacea]|uniref:Lipoprotein n=1 Tax=Pseudoalteromonas luteoviolacea S4054 TaxID=1129367 RepID=A0A0F6AII1_9GAMM|nr:hypothetical protein [Pseudoalteromonas luteoviolacea]AOT11056.1 hypothetical protein S4054249_24795 [Pseudoalteromonas luteoviolacea]AOT15780.1 hypothetical protein S40542_23715 [Pseudoalteromonas luteoviolacea]AOT20877.1 hypothetical protein S4054_24715 [Pseudoalteromonas luteoviolacea]KKE85746.1 hypothetical protein N479_24640 [Pseudoalteromonas luteoviolacea S4054]KZN71105.1 hypothetical protein N481_19695 [Pseudoalteromonas luteoviolacea S4047-1]
MKGFIGIALFCCLAVGCVNDYAQRQTDSSDPVRDNTTKVSQAVASALRDKDYRLFATTGRRPVFPGLEKLAFSMLKAKCGVKYLSGSGDVLKSEQDKQQRLERYEYAKAYNIEMYAKCKALK